MFRRSNAVQDNASFARRFMFVAAAIVIGLMLSPTLTVSSAQACSFTIEANSSIDAVSNAERIAAAMPSSVDVLSLGDGPCRNGGSEHHGSGCAGGSCATCLSAIGLVGSMLLLHIDSDRHPLPIQAGAVSTAPPPDLRPPRA